MKMLIVFVILMHVSQHASALEKYVGEFVLLPCEFPTFEMDEPSVLWSRYDLNPSTVHQRQLSGDKLTDQNKLFSGRTFMVTDALETGDLNLNLTNLHLSDSGTYTCIVKTFTGQWRLTDIKLQVKERFPSWIIFVLVALGLLVFGIIIVGSVLYHFWDYFRSVYKDVPVEDWDLQIKLPCKILFPLPKGAKVEWKNFSAIVHVFEDGPHQPDESFVFYQGRTKMNEKLVGTRDLSLTLKYPTDRDRAKFTCTVYDSKGKILREKHVNLEVKACDVEVEEGEESVKLPFQTTGDLPADVKVSWRCFIGNGEDIRKIFVYKNGKKTWHNSYRARTSMKNDMLKTGNLSLTLMNPRDEDILTYRCIVKNKGGYFIRLKTVKLKRRSPNKDTGKSGTEEKLLKKPHD